MQQAVAAAFDPGEVIPHGKDVGRLEDLAEPGRFSEALVSLGFVPLEEIPAKKGLWVIYQTPSASPKNAEPLDCLVAAYTRKETFWREKSIAYLLMSRPGTAPDSEELEHNVGIITSGLLEKSSRSMDITYAVAGAGLGFLLAYGFLPFDARFNDPSIPITGAGILNVAVPIAAGFLGAFAAYEGLAHKRIGALFAGRIPDLPERLENSKYLIIAGCTFIAAAAASYMTRYATHYDPAVSPDKLWLAVRNFGPPILAALGGGRLSAAFGRNSVSKDFWPSKNAQLSHPENYFYGPEAARALTQEIAYSRLARGTPAGSAPVSRDLFSRAINRFEW